MSKEPNHFPPASPEGKGIITEKQKVRTDVRRRYELDWHGREVIRKAKEMPEPRDSMSEILFFLGSTLLGAFVFFLITLANGWLHIPILKGN